MSQLKHATSQSKNDELQGEGNYTAAKEYDEATQAFIKSGKVKDAAANAAPKNDAEAREMQEAEEKGRAHAKPDLQQSRVSDSSETETSSQSKAGKTTGRGS